jgi:hypothetical protein
MMEENYSSKCEPRSSGKHGGSGIAGGAYFMGFIAAAVYFIQNATSFWNGVLGFLKAIVWPGFLVYYLFDFLNIP